MQRLARAHSTAFQGALSFSQLATLILPAARAHLPPSSMSASPVLPYPHIFVCDVSHALTSSAEWAQRHCPALHSTLAHKTARFVHSRDQVRRRYSLLPFCHYPCWQVLGCASKLLLAHAVHCVTGALPQDVTQMAAMDPPPKFRFVYGRYGQPLLQPLLGETPPLHMSLSHHSNVVAVALAALPVGVDVVDAAQGISGAGASYDRQSMRARPMPPLPSCSQSPPPPPSPPTPHPQTLSTCLRTSCTRSKPSGCRCGRSCFAACFNC